MNTTSRERAPSNGTEAAARVADVLLAFTDHPSLGVSEIARRLRVSKAVVHRILQSLESRGMVKSDEHARMYRLGPAVAALGARVLSDLDVRRLAMPILRRLAQQTGETTTVSALVGSSRVYLDQVVSLNEIKMTVEVGRPFPLHAGASSRAILAFLSEAVQRELLERELRSLTPNTLIDAGMLRSTLARTRQAGVAVSLGERQQGAASVAAPLFGPGNEVLGAISVCGPVDRFDESVIKRLTPMVRQAAGEISTGLGARTLDVKGAP